MSDGDTVWKQLLQIMEILRESSLNAVRVDARLAVLRKEIASFYENPAIAEERIRSLEKDAEKLALSDPTHAQSDALVRLLKVGKNPDDPDA